MIDIKGRTPKSEPKASAETYRTKFDPSASSLPLVLGGFFAAVVLYIKSMFGSAEAEPLHDQNGGIPTFASTRSGPTNDLLGAPPSEEPTPSSEPEPEPDTLPNQTPVKFSGSNVVPLFQKNETQSVPAEAKAEPDPDSENLFDQWQRLNQLDDAESPSSGALTTTGAPKGADEDEELDPDGQLQTQTPSTLTPTRTRSETNTPPHKLRAVNLTDILSGGILFISFSDLLVHSGDVDGDELSVENVSVSSGTIEQTEGGFLYYPAQGSAGQVQISYQVSDGQAHITQLAHLSVEHRPLSGSEADDQLLGTPHADLIVGHAGDDNIIGNGGQDVIHGGAGDDHIIGGSGADVIFGGGGDDIIFGRAGADQISGGNGEDELYGGEGADILLGGDGADAIHGDGGDDLLSGGASDDILDGGAGSDFVQGGAGDDLIVGTLDRSDDVYVGGDGRDTVDFRAATSDLSIDLEAGVAQSVEIGTDTLANIEIVIGGAGNDEIIGSDGNDVVVGMKGDDSISSGAGDDLIDAGSGMDVLDGGLGSDHVIGGAGDDLIIGTLDQTSDVYFGGSGTDTLDYGAATSDLVVDLRSGVVTGVETGADEIDDFEVIVAGSGDDLFLIGTNVHGVTLTGSDGDDVYHFGRSESDHSEPGQLSAVEITDFAPGDRITTGRYWLKDRDDDDGDLESSISVQTTPTESFADIDSWHEWREDREFTFIRISDGDFDDIYEAYLSGHFDIEISLGA